jgi:hypothetical protein
MTPVVRSPIVRAAKTHVDGDGTSSATPLFPRDEVRIASGVMELHWQPQFGFTVPNSEVYPWMWLWDSCFHSVIWTALEDPRAVIELESVFEYQTPEGFVPHMGYQSNPDIHAEYWRAHGHSSITQPPMFGHAFAALRSRRVEVDHLAERVRRGLLYFFRHRRADNGLIRIFHPWESGADDNPRWQPWQPAPFDRAGWRRIKDDLVAALAVQDGVAIGSSRFDVCAASFNALVAWNARVAGEAMEDDELVRAGEELRDRIDEILWNEGGGTWDDVDNLSGERLSHRTVDALLGALVTENVERRTQVYAQVCGRKDFGLDFGPASVHPDEPNYDPSGYWRGSSWPQLTYLFWRGATDSRMSEPAGWLSARLSAGANASGFAEYWDPRDGQGFGARPQSWTCLAAVPTLETRRSSVFF